MADDRKGALRQQVAARRRELVVGRDRAADAEALAIDALAAAHDAGVRAGDWVAAYESLPTEPPTEATIAALAARGIRVMVPITLPGWDLDWREVGTDEPLGADAVATARLVLVPAQAIDGAGARLGRGKGCYDRVLPRTRAVTVAVVHPWEVTADDLPVDPPDQPVDAVMAAGLGLRWFRRSPRPARR